MRILFHLLAIALVATPIVTTTASAMERERSAIIPVSGSALVFDGPGLLSPDIEGHFIIGIRLPQPSIVAGNCETPNLILGIGTLNKPENELTDSDLRIIGRNKRYYSTLVDASAHRATIFIPVRNRQRYLRVKGGVVTAPFCILSIDQRKLP